MPDDDDCPPTPPHGSLPYRPLRRLRPAAEAPAVDIAAPAGRSDDRVDLGWLSLLELAFDDDLLHRRK